MASSCEIQVEGHSILHRQAERAVLNVSISSSRTSKEQASKEATAAARNLQRFLEPLSPRNDYGEAVDDAKVTHFAMSSIRTSSHIPTENHGKRIGDEIFRAYTDFEVKFKDFATLGKLAREFSAMDYVQVNGVDWKLTTETKESLASHNRREAMRDAVNKTIDYADALRLQSFTPIEVKEGRVYERTSGHGKVFSPPPKKNQVFDDSNESLAFVAEDVELHAVVHAKFQVDQTRFIQAQPDAAMGG